MKNPFRNLSEEEKKKSLKRTLWTFGLTVFILGGLFFFVDFGSDNQQEPNLNYTFILGGEEMESIMVCEDLWHYELIDGFIPCVVNKTVGGIGGEYIDWTKSPQENCEAVDGEFIGFNLYNETRAKEQYDVLLPYVNGIKKLKIS